MSLNLILQYVIPHHILSRLVAKIANCHIGFIKNFIIHNYCKFYHIDLKDALEENYLNYPTFNAFFTRYLKPQARPIADDPQTIISPVDGKIWQIGKFDNKRLINAKNHAFTVRELLADPNEANLFTEGNFAVLYLAPYNYHRIHMPIDGKLKSMRHIPGKLFSVNPKIAAELPNLFAKNERVVNIFETVLGPVALIFVGAMIVGSIETAWAGTITPRKKQQLAFWDYNNQNITFKKGEIIGSFKLGSTVILLFPKNTVDWHNIYTTDTVINMGQSLGTIL